MLSMCDTNKLVVLAIINNQSLSIIKLLSNGTHYNIKSYNFCLTFWTPKASQKRPVQPAQAGQTGALEAHRQPRLQHSSLATQPAGALKAQTRHGTPIRRFYERMNE